MAQRNRTFQTDTVISKFNRQKPSKEKVLHMWEPASMDDDHTGKYDLGSRNNNDSGWDVNDMFKRNERVYGVKSNFDETLRGYTTEIKTDAPNFKELEEKAARLAREIQSNSISRRRAELENCDEEETFAAVSQKKKGTNNNRDKKYFSAPQKPGSQQYFSGPRNTQNYCHNQHKYNSKYELNERWDNVSGPGTKNFNRNRRPNHHGNNNLNEPAISRAKVGTLKKGNADQKVSEKKMPSLHIRVDDDNDQNKCSKDLNLPEIKTKKDTQISSSSVVEVETQFEDLEIMSEACCFPLQETQKITAEKDESLQLFYDSVQDREKDIVVVKTVENDHVEQQHSTHLNINEIDTQNVIKDSSPSSPAPVVAEIIQPDDYLITEVCCLSLQEEKEKTELIGERLRVANDGFQDGERKNAEVIKPNDNLEEYGKDNNSLTDIILQDEPGVAAPAIVVAEIITPHQLNQRSTSHVSHSPAKQLITTELSGPIDESRAEFSHQILNKPLDEEDEKSEMPNEVKFKLNPNSKAFQPRNDPTEIHRAPVYESFLHNEYQNYYQHNIIIIPHATVQYAIPPEYFYAQPRLVFGFQQLTPLIITPVPTVIFTIV